MRSQLKRIISVVGLVLACLFIQATAQAQFTVIHSFGLGAEGYDYPVLCLRIGKIFYGTTSHGGQYGHGTIFTMDTSGNVSVVHPFTDAEGTSVDYTMSYSGGWIFGATQYGGANNLGYVFRMRPNGSYYRVLFTGSAASTSCCYPFLAGVLNGVIYGSGELGGANGDGALFAMRTDGSNFTLLHSFDGIDGIEPQQPILVMPSRYTTPLLVGCASVGGASNFGVIYRMNLDGSGFAVLHEFDGSDGDGNPESKPLLLGGTLWGSCRGTSPNADSGTVWKLDGTGYQVLHTFNGTDGADPDPQLLLNGTFYGQTDGGSTAEIYSMVPNGSGFTIRHVFNPSVDGWGLCATNLLIPYNGVIYGTTGSRGIYGGGTAWAFAP